MARLAAVAALLFVVAAAQGERLPIRIYATADGLPHININCIVRDTRGFLWMCTDEGLSRFDGTSFTSYTVRGSARDSLDVGGAAVDFIEARNGDYWAATAHALCHFHSLPKNGHPPAPPRPDFPAVRIAEAPGGNIWFLTNRGLFQFLSAVGKPEPVDLGLSAYWTALREDSDGSLWLGAEGTLVHRLQDGRVERFGEAERLPADANQYFRVSAALRDREKRLWVATWQGLCLMAPRPEPGNRSVDRVYTVQDGLAGNVVSDVFESRDGKLWVSTEKGLSEWQPGVEGRPDRFRSYTARKGFDLFGVDGPAEPPG